MWFTEKSQISGHLILLVPKEKHCMYVTRILHLWRFKVCWPNEITQKLVDPGWGTSSRRIQGGGPVHWGSRVGDQFTKDPGWGTSSRRIQGGGPVHGGSRVGDQFTEDPGWGTSSRRIQGRGPVLKFGCYNMNSIPKHKTCQLAIQKLHSKHIWLTCWVGIAVFDN